MDPDAKSTTTAKSAKPAQDRAEEREEGEEGDENEEEGLGLELEEEEEEDPFFDPFLTYPEPSHRGHTPAERIRPRSSIKEVTSYTEYNPYIGAISLKYPRKRRGALPNSIYRRPPEIIPPPVDKWQLYKSEIGAWKPMSLTTICRKFDPAWKDRDENDVINDGY